MSGFVTYDEVVHVMRRKLKRGPSAVPDTTLKGLWCALDKDDSNQVLADEFRAFIKLYTPPKSDVAKFGGKGFVKGGSFTDGSAMTRAIESTPTAEMRAELEAAGVRLDDAELTYLCAQFTAWFEAARQRDNQERSHSWANVFADVDRDGR